MALRAFNAGHPILALYDDRLLTTKKSIIVVVVQGPDPADTGSTIKPMGCTAFPENPFNKAGAGRYLLWLIPIFMNASQKRMSDKLLLSTSILRVVSLATSMVITNTLPCR